MLPDFQCHRRMHLSHETSLGSCTGRLKAPFRCVFRRYTSSPLTVSGMKHSSVSAEQFKKFKISSKSTQNQIVFTYFVNAVPRTETELEGAQVVRHQLNDHVNHSAGRVHSSGNVAHQFPPSFVRSRPSDAVRVAANSALSLVDLPLIL